MSEKLIVTEEDQKVLATLQIQNNKDGNGLVAQSLDGKPLSTVQQAAVAKFEKIVFPAKAAAAPEAPVTQEPKK